MPKVPWADALKTFTEAAKKANSFDVVLKAGDVEFSFYSLDTDLELQDVVDVLRDAASFVAVRRSEDVRFLGDK